MITFRFFIIVTLVAILSGKILVSPSGDLQDDIQIQARPILNFEKDNAACRRFGSLEFRGGLQLSSPSPKFGGISAIRVQSDGTNFLALSDRAYWLRGRIVYNGENPSAIEDAVIAPILGPDGKPAAGWDTESIAQNGSWLYVGVEGLDRIPVFFSDAGKFPVFRDAIIFLPGTETLPKNQGLEALAFIPDRNSTGGVLAAFSERGLDKDGNILAFLIQGADQKTFTVKRSGDYDISDAVLLPDGDLLILERKYDIVKGAAMRIRRVPLEAVLPDSVVDGPVVMEADARYQIDNMEAISAHRDTSGEVVLTLMSDDNFSPDQRTLLLQFTIMDQ